MQEILKARKQHFFDRLSLSTSEGDNADIDYITDIAERVNVCSVEPSDKGRLPKEIFYEMPNDNKPIEVQVDCGSSINIMSKELVGNCNLAPTSKTLIMWNKTEVMPLGTTKIIETNPQNRQKYSVEFVVLTKNLTSLIGARVSQHMKILAIEWNNLKSVQAPNRKDAVVHQLLTV